MPTSIVRRSWQSRAMCRRRSSGAASRWQSVIDRHRLPFASTTMAKGMVPEDHPLSLGCIERARRQVQRELLRSADLVVGLGYDVVEVEYEAWIGKVPLLSIDVDPVDADRSVTIAHEVIGDLDAALEWLAQLPALRPDTHQIASQWTAHAPRTFLITNGSASTGIGLPAGIAAKLARPQRRVG